MSAPRSPSGDGPVAGRGVPFSLIAVVALTSAIRLIAGASLHLTEDEAYYRLWSLAPAFGYYDHPPMIAWWIWLGRQIAGDTPLGARLIPIAACAATSFLAFDLARQAGANGRAAARAGVWWNAMPLIAAGGLLAIPDAPATLFWTASLCCAMRAARASSTRWWLAAGLMAGLAALSKYSALFLAPGILLWLAWTPQGRARLRQPGPWLAALLAVFLFSLNLAWNATHHWLTVAKQFGRVAPTGLAPWRLVEFLLVQVLLLNPLVAAFVVRAVTRRPETDHGGLTIAPFVATSAPFVAYLLIHALHDRVQGHWAAPIYPALAIVAAAGADRIAGSPAWARLKAATPCLGFGACVMLLAWVALPPAFTGDFDLARPVRGWPAFANQVEALRVRRGAAWIGTASYGLDAELADEPAVRAPVFQISERVRYRGLSTGAAPDLSRPGLLVDLPRRIDPRALRRCFARVTALGAIARGEPGGAQTVYAATLVSAPRRDLLRTGC
ncbi:MAG: glycosyltransferase family 39 protein [Caulobacteraceae bacterium]